MKCGKNGKTGDWGMCSMVFVGNAENHSIDCYRMWNTKSCKFTESHDETWLCYMNYQDNIMMEMVKLPERLMSVFENSKDTIASFPLEGSIK